MFKIVFMFLMRNSVTIAILATMAFMFAGCDVPFVPLI
jgi:hypothetical protein